ncbi:MAG: glycosyltransferase [Firmicutes bacterium]|nr:glycosyltransferase [Bacillota bacterium]
MPFSVLITTNRLDIGGAETHVVTLARHLKEIGHRVALASAGGRYVVDLEGYGIPHYPVPLDSNRLGDIYCSVVELRKIIDREGIGLIHAHARIPAMTCDLARRGRGIPLVTTAHGRFKTPLHLRLLSRWGDKTIAISPDIRDYLLSSYWLSPQNITLIPNGIDLDLFNPAIEPEELALAGGTLRIAYFSRLDGPLTRVALNLIEAFLHICPDFPGLRLLLGGEGSGASEVLARVNEINHGCGTELVRFLGAVPLVNRVMVASDLVVGVSRVALEGMACARNVMLAGGEGFGGIVHPEALKELAGDNFTGRSLPNQATTSLLEASLREFLNTPADERARVAGLLRQFVVDNYGSRQMVEETVRVYETALRGG